MRVLLVDPPGKNKGFNTGLGFLSAVLKPEHDVMVLDLNNIQAGLCGDANPELSLPELEAITKEAIRRFRADILGISIKTFTAEISRHLFRWAAEAQAGIVRVAGGPHLTLDGFRYVRDTGVEYGVQGEGEYVFPQLAAALRDGRSTGGIKGLLSWEDGDLVQGLESDLIEQLDALPFPDYSSFSSVAGRGGRMEQYPILTSRGCPFKCSYCSMPTIMGRRWRHHSPERIVAELKRAREIYGARSFTVVDDNLTLDLRHVEAICDQILQAGLAMPWNSMNGIRADRLTAGTATKMRASGCYHVWIGIEAADRELFDTINKGEQIEDVKRGIRTLKQAGIGVGGFFIVGLPHATREKDLRTIDFVREMGIDAWWFQFVPYPYTPANDWVQTDSSVRILRPAEGALQFGSGDIEPVFETTAYSKQERMRTYDEIHIRMGFFDRLFDPGKGQWGNLRRVFRKVAPHGPGAMATFGTFILAHNVKKAARGARKAMGLPPAHVPPPPEPPALRAERRP